MIELPDSQLLEPVYGTGSEVENIVLNGESVVSYSYDDSGNLTSSTDALGSVTNYTYNCWDELISTTDALGNTTTYSYDSAGCCTGVTYPDGSTHSISYDKSGRPVRMSTYVTDILTGDTREVSSSLAYDMMGNVSSYKDEMGNVTNYEYDLMNNLIKVTDGEGNIQSEYTYDCLGRVISARDSSGITTAYTYNKSGLVEKVEQTSPGGESRTYTYTYDTMGRLLSVTDPTGVTTSQSFDESGNLSEIVYPQGGSISYSYDELGRVTVEALSIGTEKAYSYSAEGLLNSSTNGRGQETSYSYDEIGRLVSYTDEVGTVSYAYDKNGNLISTTETTADGESRTIARTYDSMNRVATYTDYNGNTVKYGYDELGNIVSLTYPGGEIVRYSYYDNGLLAAVVDGEGYKTSYTYDSAGRELTIAKADGSVETKTYNDKGYLTTVTLEAAGEEVYSYIYTYDEWGNITGIVYESQSEKETDLSTLTSSTMTYDECNRMVTYNGEDILYDEDGNMMYGPLDGEMVTFEYDCRNRLIRAGETTYEYDAEDVRIAVETPEYREEYVTDSVTTLSRVLEVERVYKNTMDIPATSSVGTTVGTTTKESEDSTYYYGNGLLYEKNSTYSLLVYHYDHLGSTKLITDTNGSVIAEFSYGTYGELLTDTTEYDITLRFLYNGKLGVITDDNSLCYMRTRYYNPEIKRFINQDIIKGSITNSLSLNRYSYVEGNPVTYTDPFGLSPFLQGNGLIHAGLDLLGCIPGPIGFISDMVNAGIYLAEGNKYQAMESVTFSLVGCDLSLKAAKYSVKLGKFSNTARGVAEIIDVGAHATAIVFASHDLGTGIAAMIDKYLVNEEDITIATAAEALMLGLGATHLGLTAHYTSKIPDTLDEAAKIATTKPTDPVEVKFADSDPYVVDEALKGYEMTVSVGVSKGGKGSITYGELDSLGRTTGIEATITQDMIGTGSSAKSSIKPAGFGGQAQGHARGHLLGNQLGGSGSDPRNLVTIYQNPVNHPVMSSIEAKVRKAVEDGQIVNYKVTPIYEGNNLIPSGITIQAQGSGGLKIYQTILNRK